MTKEAQFLHWTQTQVTTFPVVTYYKDSNLIFHEDQLIFISPDLKPDAVMVELIHKKTADHYASKNINVNQFIEFNDGSSGQFKDIKFNSCIKVLHLRVG